MKKTNLTFLKSLKMWIGTLLVFSTLAVSAQCSLNCTALENVSVDANCRARITPAIFGTQGGCTSGVFSVRVYDKHGDTIPNATVDSSHVGLTLTVELRNITISGSDTIVNSCRGQIKVEDKMAPRIDCTNNLDTVKCNALSTYVPSMIIDNCGDARLTHTLIHTETNCDTLAAKYGGGVKRFIRAETRRYVAKDSYGNVSAPCDITVLVDTISQAGLQYPTNRIGSDALVCDANFAKDANGNPHPSVTGYPTLYGVQMNPNDPNISCGLVASYTDSKPVKIGCKTKIFRRWEVMSWNCALSGQFGTIGMQMIEIADTLAPTFDPVQDITATTYGRDCKGYVTVKMPANIKDNCSSRVTVNVSNNVTAPAILNMRGDTKLELPQGNSQLYYELEDECGNISRDTVNVFIEDNTRPVAICVGKTVSLTNGGVAWMPAEAYDKGSYDECALKTMVVRRMTSNTCEDCEVPRFDHMTYRGEVNGTYYYVSNHKFNYRISAKHATALTGQLVDYSTVSADVQALYAADLARESFHTLNNPVRNAAGAIDTAKYLFQLSDACGFSKHVKFCCNDLTADNPAMVVFRVIDHNGNWNESMIETTVQDKIPAQVTCPPDTTVNCDTPYDLDRLGLTFGEPTVVGGCKVNKPQERVSVDLNDCKIGTITRTFTLGSSTCSQVIRFRAITPFDGRTIQWPVDTAITACADPTSGVFSPNNLGTPTYTGGSCDFVGHRYKDEPYTFNNPKGEACFKIIRKWEVINWCVKYGPTQLNPTTGGYGGYAKWTHLQTIKVSDAVAPEFVVAPKDTTICTYDADCSGGNLSFKYTGRDACTNDQNLKWSCRVYLNNTKGSFDAGLSNSGSGNEITTAGKFPVGTHRIEYTFEDGCGNSVTKIQIVKLLNCKAPTPQLLHLTTTLMPVQLADKSYAGMVLVDANEFNNGSSHPCQASKNYRFAFSFAPVTYSDAAGLTTVSKREYTCDSIGVKNVRVYVAVLDSLGKPLFDTKGNVVQDFAVTTVTIQGNITDDKGRKICDANFGKRISGRIATESDKKVEGASIQLVGSELGNAMTSESGQYTFPEMATGGKYSVVPSKGGNVYNGVNTRDLLAIQRHLLKIEKMTSPYQIIAADANRDGKVNPQDLLLMRKVILRLNDSFKGNTNWRFVDKGYKFENAAKPLKEAFPEIYEINEFNNDMAIDFVAIKVGDVNNSARTSSVANTKAETRSVVEMTVAETNFEAGNRVTVPVSLNADELAGFQFTLDYDASQVRLVDITSDAINISSDNLAVLSDNGVATVSWNSTRNVDVKAGEALFNLVFEAVAAGKLSSAVAFNSNVTEAELYTVEADYNLGLVVENRSAQTREFALYQNTPNPFKGSTIVAVDMPSTTAGSLTIMDVTGKVIKSINTTFTAGRNELKISDLGAKGVYYYTVKAGEFTATKKMVVIQ